MLEKVPLIQPIPLIEQPMLEKVPLIQPIPLIEQPMLEKVPLIRLKMAIWDEYARIRCTNSN